MSVEQTETMQKKCKTKDKCKGKQMDNDIDQSLVGMVRLKELFSGGFKLDNQFVESWVVTTAAQGSYVGW